MKNSRHICPSCQKTYAEKTNLCRHIRTVHNKKDPLYCGECGKAFVRKDHLSRHIAQIHSTDAPSTFFCDACSKVFRRQGALSQHTKQQHSNNPIKAECKKCGKTFTTKHNRNMHELHHCPSLREGFLDTVEGPQDPDDFVVDIPPTPSEETKQITPPRPTRNPLLLVRKIRPTTANPASSIGSSKLSG